MHLLTPPTVEPVTVSEVKAALRIDDTRFDLQSRAAGQYRDTLPNDKVLTQWFNVLRSR